MTARVVIEALRDRRLMRRDLRIYADALECLSFVEAKPYKVIAVARVTGIHVAHVAASLRRLTASGYLERGAKVGQLRTYILCATTQKPTRAA